MSIYKLRITARRNGHKLTTISSRVVEQLPPDPNYWLPAARLLYERLIEAGIIPDQAPKGPQSKATAPIESALPSETYLDQRKEA